MILQELRIGNLILTSEKTGQKPYLRSIVKEIRENGVIVDGDRFCKAEDIAGIELTEEWFNKLGFKKYCGIWENEGLRINEYEENEYNLLISEWIFFESVKIKTVHHLQNLFGDLRGEQLKIKLDQPNI